MPNEIGSEFWYSRSLNDRTKSSFAPNWLNIGDDTRILLSGRTALDFIIRDILCKEEINSVYFPSYSCQSMIQPFVDNNINVIFYNVNVNKESGDLEYNIDVDTECDVFFAMNYFGFHSGNMDYYIDAFVKRNKIVIEDITHSLLSKRKYNYNTHYVFSSLRKWFPIPSGGCASKIKGNFNIELNSTTNNEFVTLRKTAMLQKKQFMNGLSTKINKRDFLENYKQASLSLLNSYSGYPIDNNSMEILNNLDIDEIAMKRKTNTKTYYDELSQSNKVDFLYDKFSIDEDCPIFVPIINMKREFRNALREYLIKNKVYLPIHWPPPHSYGQHINLGAIYNSELSLVNDQRYDVDDIKKVASLILSFIRGF